MGGKAFKTYKKLKLLNSFRGFQKNILNFAARKRKLTKKAVSSQKFC